MSRITARDRRGASYVGYLAPQPDGSWSGLLTDQAGGELLLKGEVDRIGEVKRVSLIATHGVSPDAARLRREDGE